MIDLTDPVFIAVFIGIWVVYLWESYLHYRQHALVKKLESYPYDRLKDIMDKESFTKARLYSLDRSIFEFWSGIINQVISSVILLFAGMPYAWGLSVSSASYLSMKSEYWQSVFFLLYTSLFNTIVSMPLSIYSTFVIEQKHGFNKQTPGFYAKDQIKKFIVGQAIMIPVTVLLLWIIDIGGNMFFFWAWLFLFIVSMIFIFIYHDFIAPLFDTYTPVPEGELRSAIEDLCSSHNFPLCKLLIVEGSKRSAHSNAYFYGFWKSKKIVLYDTLLEDSPLKSKEEESGDKDEQTESDKPKENETKKKKGCNIPEILAVLAHELGHWSLWHNFKNLIVTQVNLFTSFALFGLLIEFGHLFAAFGFQPNSAGVYPTIIRLVIVFQFILMPYHEVVNFLMTWNTRRFEFQADKYAVDDSRGDKLMDALVKLQNDNLSFPLCDWLYSTWNYSHPPILERIDAIKRSAKKLH